MKNLILSLESKSLFTQRIALARSLFAIGALLTIVFNSVPELKDAGVLNIPNSLFSMPNYFLEWSIFTLLPAVWSKLLCVVILLWSISGRLPQASIFFQVWVQLSICNSFVVVEGGDQIASNILILLVPICVFDSRANQWKAIKNSQTRWTKFVNVFLNVYYLLILIQVSVIYLHSANGKLYNDEWRTGTCLYFWLTHNVYGAPEWLQHILNPVMLSDAAPLFAWSVIILELLLAGCIMVQNRKLKLLFLGLGLVFHFTIFLCHGLLSFFFSMAGALLLYLDDKNYFFNRISTFFKSWKIKNSKPNFLPAQNS